jgi:hypothetical protein
MAIAIDAAVTENTWEPVREENASPTYTAVVIWDGSNYAALCRELDIASSGDSANEAFFFLKSAVREAVAVAKEKGIEPGTPVPDEALSEFLALHKLQMPVAGFVFTA